MGLKYNRRLNRLKGYDYTQDGYYFVTICVKGREHVFGMVRDGAMHLSNAGNIVVRQMSWLAERYSYVSIDSYVVMPDHLHCIIVIDRTMQCRDRSRPVPTQIIKPLWQLVGALKTRSSKDIRKRIDGTFQWQRSFHDHIIRNEQSLLKLRKYMHENPLRWDRVGNGF